MTNQEAIAILRCLKDREAKCLELIRRNPHPNRLLLTTLAIDMAIDALKCKPTVIRCEKLLSKEDFEAVVKRIHEENQNVIVIPYEAEVVSTIQEKHQLSEETPTNTSTNTSTKSTNTSIDISTEAPRPIEPTITVDLESGIIPRSAIEKRPHDVTVRINDLISRKEAINAITETLDEIDHVPKWVFEKLSSALEALPSIEK